MQQNIPPSCHPLTAHLFLIRGPDQKEVPLTRPISPPAHNIGVGETERRVATPSDHLALVFVHSEKDAGWGYVCMRVCCKCKCVRVFVYVPASCLHACMCLRAYGCVHVCVCVFACLCACACECLRVCANLFVCVSGRAEACLFLPNGRAHHE